MIRDSEEQDTYSSPQYVIGKKKKLIRKNNWLENTNKY